MQVSLISYPTDADWIEVKRRALITIGKSKVINAPDLEWKIKMLRARHSPIRALIISFYIENLPYWVSNELCRHHIGIEKYVRSQRNDRQKDYDRNTAQQDAPVNVIVDFNAEAFMTYCNKRLCRCASKEMQELTRTMAELLEMAAPEFAGLLVPNCIHQGGICYEMACCGYNKNYSKLSK